MKMLTEGRMDIGDPFCKVIRNDLVTHLRRKIAQILIQSVNISHRCVLVHREWAFNATGFPGGKASAEP